MVKIPEKVPVLQDIAQGDFKKILMLSKDPYIQSLIDKTDTHYYYWDKVRSQPIPKEFDRKEIWSFIRFRRLMNSSPSPVLDKNFELFTFWLTDNMQRDLHIIDQDAGGSLALTQLGSDKREFTKYMITCLMEEAITSSQIEGAVSTIKEAKKMLLEKRKPKDKSEKMIYNNYITMQSLKDLCKKELSVDLLMDLHTSITKGTLDSEDEEGRFRNPEEITRVMSDKDEILFVPPKAEEIPERMNKLLAFANDMDSKPFIHPVVKAIILHFWLAYIHPFTDGNGRMSRALFYWYMLKHNYWLFEFTSISKIILKKQSQYGEAYLHTEHDDNDLTYFIHFHIGVIMDAVKELKEHILKEREKNIQIHSVISKHPDLNVRQTRILQHLTLHPHESLTIKIHQNANKLAYQTARTDLVELEQKKWLRSIKKGNTFYYLPAENFMEMLQENNNES